MRADRRAESFWLRSGLALAAVLWAGAVEAQFTNVTATSGAINVVASRMGAWPWADWNEVGGRNPSGWRRCVGREDERGNRADIGSV